ncbi:MAG: hypothetical protein IJM59_11900 [Proteobacteria bacterium]|nr:hypothetical protein [Pseudomonadota bacterium]
MKNIKYFILISACLTSACTLEEVDPNASAAKFCEKIKGCDLYPLLQYADDSSCIADYNATKLTHFSQCQNEYEAFKMAEITGVCTQMADIEKDPSFLNENLQKTLPESILEKRNAFLTCLQNNDYCMVTSCIDSSTLGECSNNKLTKRECPTGQCQNNRCVETCQSDTDCPTKGDICKDGKCIQDCPEGTHRNEATQKCVVTCAESESQCVSNSEKSLIKRCVNGEFVEEECAEGATCQVSAGTPQCATPSDLCTEDAQACIAGKVMICENERWTLKDECRQGFGCVTSMSNVYCAECETGSISCDDNHYQSTCNAGNWQPNFVCCEGYQQAFGTCKPECPPAPTCIDDRSYRFCDFAGNLQITECTDNTVCIDGECRKACTGNNCGETCTGTDCNEPKENDCDPACDEGEHCVEGQCLPDCDPACKSDEVCVEGQCQPCTGDDCPCTGDDCPCTGDDCPCTGDNCPCTNGETKCGTNNNLLTCTQGQWKESNCSPKTCQANDNGASCVDTTSDPTCAFGMWKYQQGESICQNNQLSTCNNGAWKVTACASNEECTVINDTNAKCSPKCTTTTTCDGSKLITKCGDTIINQQTCEFGCQNNKCLECTPGTKKCETVYMTNYAKICQDNGTWSTTPCAMGFQCFMPTGKDPYCAECVENQLTCNGKNLQICKDGKNSTQQTCNNQCYPNMGNPYCDECKDGDTRCSGTTTLQVCQIGKYKNQTTCTNKCYQLSGETPYCGECKDGDKKCYNSSTPQLCENGKYKNQKTCSSGLQCKDGTCQSTSTCGNGQIDSGEQCDGSVSIKCYDIVPDTCKETKFSGSPECNNCKHDVGSCEVLKEVTSCRVSKLALNDAHTQIQLNATLKFSGPEYPEVYLYCTSIDMGANEAVTINNPLEKVIVNEHKTADKCSNAHEMTVDYSYPTSNNDIEAESVCFIYIPLPTKEEGVFCKDDKIIRIDEAGSVADIYSLKLDI